MNIDISLAAALVIAVIAGIFLRSIIHAALLVGIVVFAFLLSCYAFDISPRVLLFDANDAVHAVEHEARHEYRLRRQEIMHKAEELL